MSDVEETEVERLLAAAANDSGSIPAFLTALLGSTVLVPGVVDPAVEGERPTVTLAPLVRADGAAIQPFYTSERALQLTVAAIPGYEGRYIALGCRDLWQMTRGSTLVLNPHSPSGKEFLPGEIGQLLDGAATLTPRTVTEGTEVLVGSPAVVPPGMEDALASLFARYPSVERVTLGWKVTPSDDDQSYLLVVEGPEHVRDEVSAELGSALVLFSQAHPVDVMYAAPRAKHMLASLAPFYERARAR